MALALVHSRALRGLDAPEVTVEVHLANGLPSFTLVGLVDTEVKESRERVRAALQTSGLEFPHNKRVTVSLAPADLPKESARFDLPIAIGILAAAGQLDAARLEGFELAGELSLGGELRPVPGALAIGLATARQIAPPRRRWRVCRARSCSRPRAPPRSRSSAGSRCAALGHLLDVVRAFLPGDAADDAGLVAPPAAPPVSSASAAAGQPDLRDVRGQSAARRALEVAATGEHGLLMVGPPGSGKSMLAQRLPGLLPPLDHDAALEAAAVQSIAGTFDLSHWGRRPFRAPHHGASAAALVGGGSPPRPGEVSLAHRGTLFLDELPEFPRSALEALREPLENGRIVVSRAARRAEFPARFQLVAAMNPCPCGDFGDRLRACRCTPDAVLRYRARVSGPLLDRIDLQVEVPAVDPDAMVAAPAGEPSAAVAARVAVATARAIDRQGCVNARLDGEALDRHAALDDAAAAFLRGASARLGWSGRGLVRVVRVARSVADLAGHADIATADLAEAIQYRRVLFGT